MKKPLIAKEQAGYVPLSQIIWNRRAADKGPETVLDAEKVEALREQVWHNAGSHEALTRGAKSTREPWRTCVA